MLLMLGVVTGACGKKGPPLAPLVLLPDRMNDIKATRLGDTIYVRFTVPSTNIDATTPADLDRIEVYAYTALEAAEGRDLKRTRLIATIPVKAPPKPPEAEDPDKPPAPPQDPPEPGVEQGQTIAIAETVSDELRVPLPPDPKAPKPPPIVLPTSKVAEPLPLPLPTPEPARFYVAVGLSRKNKRGGLSPRPAALLDEAPPAPDAPAAVVTEPAVVLTWKRPPTLRRPYLDPEVSATREALIFGWPVTLPAPPRLASTFKGLPPQPTIAYHVYRASDPDAPSDSGAAAGPGDAPPVPGVVDMPLPIAEKPIETFTFSDPITQWGVRRCYEIRTVQTVDTAVTQSRPSPVTCVTPEDTFPPAAPASLAAIASQGAISLIWDSVTASDLAGYVVLRGLAPDGALEPLFETPIRQTTYRDETATPGVRYLYEVVAVDNAAVPNRSLPSNRVTEAAR